MIWLVYCLAAILEIAGSLIIWRMMRDGAHPWLALPALACLFGFAALLARVEIDAAGRAFAAYGGVYIVTSLVAMVLFDGRRPDAYDLAGAALCLIGAAVIVLPHRL